MNFLNQRGKITVGEQCAESWWKALALSTWETEKWFSAGVPRRLCKEVQTDFDYLYDFLSKIYFYYNIEQKSIPVHNNVWVTPKINYKIDPENL